MVSIDTYGRAHGQRSVSDALAKEDSLAEELAAVKKHSSENTLADPRPSVSKDKATEGGKLILAEDVNQGQLGWASGKSILTMPFAWQR